MSVVEPGSEDLRLFNCLLRRYHYLGHRNTAGILQTMLKVAFTEVDDPGH